MTAEETALEEFRMSAQIARGALRVARWHREQRRYDLADAERIGFLRARASMRRFARIIRAIRAERGQERRDALRGVQGAALYRHAELWHGRVRLTSAEERRDIEACELAWAAKAAEEAAR